MKMEGCSTSQSSTGWGGKPWRAVDGNTSGNYKDKSCTHTQNEQEGPAWWRIDLPKPYHIDAV